MCNFLWFCTPNILKWPVNEVYRSIPQQFVIFYWNFDKSYSTAADCTYYMYKLDNLGEIWQNFVNWLEKCSKLPIHYIHEWWLCYEQGWKGGNNQNFDYFPIKFNGFNQINNGRITFDLFYWIFDKIYQPVTCNQLQYINNRTYKHGFSTKW